jgi:lysozyme
MALGPSSNALNLIKDREGYRPVVYTDTLGYLTAGYGHRLTPEEQKLYTEGSPVDKEVAENWLRQDSVSAHQAAVQQANQLGIKDANFVDTLTSVNFQLGPNWWDDSVNPRAHKKTWELLKDGDYLNASKEVYDSEWYKQTPIRVEDFANAIRGLAKQDIRETKRTN